MKHQSPKAVNNIVCMCLKIKILISTLLFCSHTISAQLESFESNNIPNGWSCNKGNLSTTGEHYKLGQRSLQWEWQAHDYLRIINPSGLTEVAAKRNGGIVCWIYNTNPISEAIIFSFRNNSDKEQCKITFQLNFRGWRKLEAEFKSDMQHLASNIIEQIIIEAPKNGSGTLCFDYLEFPEVTSWERMNDLQQTQIVQSYRNVDDFVGAYNRTYNEVIPSERDLQAINLISDRIDEWFLWNSESYQEDQSFKQREKAVNSWITRTLRKIQEYDLKESDNMVVTGPSLYPQASPQTASDGTPLIYFSTIGQEYLIPLAIDWRQNKKTSSALKIQQVYDWFSDQGWACGSGMGTLRFEKLRSGGYFHSLFLMRNDLGEKRFARELESLKWFSLIGYTQQPYFTAGETADNFRTLLQPKLYYALMQPDKEIAVSLLFQLKKYIDDFFSPSDGYLGILKSDFTGYHHKNIYLSAYYSQALYVVSLINYWLKDTPFELSPITQQNLKSALLTIDRIAARYDVPNATNGRFPKSTETINFLLPAFAYVSLSQDGDPEIDQVLKRRWIIEDPKISYLIGRSTPQITFTQTKGEIGLILSAIDSISDSVSSDEESNTCFYPNAGILISKTPQRHISVKGFSKYIWDYESSISDNIYGRYLSYGQLEYTDMNNERKNNAFSHPSWNWNQIPGTTNKVLSEQSLDYNRGGNKLDRNFSDQSFLGGISINDTTSFFSFQLHDITFDKSFYANKSVLIWGNTILCLGSNITVNGKSVPVITTILQQELKNNESVYVNSAPVSQNMNAIQNAIIRDNQDITYIVKDGLTDINKNENLISAFINHGNDVSDAGYQYYMLVKASDQMVTQCVENPAFEVLKSDKGAHVLKIKEDSSFVFSIFDTKSHYPFSILKSVNHPSLMHLKPVSNGYQVVVQDPDLRRGTAVNMTSLTDEATVKPCEPSTLEFIFDGLFDVESDDKSISLTRTSTTTILSISVKEGRNYSFKLKETATSLNHNKMNKFFMRYDYQTKLCEISNTNQMPFNGFISSVDGRELSSFSNQKQPVTLDFSKERGSMYLITVFDENQYACFKVVNL